MSTPPNPLEALIATMPFAAFLGVQATLQGDEVLITVPFKPELVGNPFVPALHGGVLGAVLEITAIAQLALARESETVRKPIDVQVEYLRSAGERDLHAAARVVRIGRRVAHVQAEAWQESRAKPVALLQADFLVDEAN